MNDSTVGQDEAANVAPPAGTVPASSNPVRHPPAMTGRIWGVLLRNEWFKVRKRVAFWLAFGFYAFIQVMDNAQSFVEVDEDFKLPDVWSSVFSDDLIVMFFFAGISIILLTSTEFSWRTARQQVIDGLSKSQWFWGKAMLLPLIGFVYIGAHVLIPGVMALIRTDFASASGPLVPFSVLQAAGGLAIGLTGLGSLGFFLSLAVRNTGGAMGIWFLWILPMEQLILPGLINQFAPSISTWPQYLPFNSATRLLSYPAYDAPTFERIAAAAVEAGNEAPAMPEVLPYVTASTVWTVGLILVAFVWFKRRDL